MKRKWNRLLVISVLIVSMVLSGCGGDGPLTAEESETSSSNMTVLSDDTAELSETEAIIPEVAKGTLRACVLFDSYFHNSGYHFQTDRYFFELKHLGQSVENESYVLTVTDFATKQQSALCSVEGCTHDDETCPAFVKGGASILEADGKLLLIRRAEAVYDDNFAEGVTEVERMIPGSITMMDLDGGNPRKLVEEFDDFETDWFTDDSHLYGVRVTPAPEGGDPDYDKKRHLFRMSLETGEMVDLLELSLYECFPIGVFDGKILLRNMSYPKPNRGLEEAEWEVNQKAGRYQFMTVDPATGANHLLEKDLSVWDDNGAYWGDGHFYYTKSHSTEKVADYTPDLYRLDLSTLNVETIISGEENHVYHVDYIFDSKIIYSYSEFKIANDILDYVDEGTSWLDLTTGESQPSTLYFDYEYEMFGSMEPVHEMVYPLADAGDYYLVNSNVQQVNTVTGAGFSSTLVVYQRSLILKTDYWAGQANYIPITVL